MQARLLDAVTGRSGTAHATWLQEQGLEFRVQQTLHRGHRDDPLYRIRRTMMTGVEHLTDKQTARLHRQPGGR